VLACLLQTCHVTPTASFILAAPRACAPCAPHTVHPALRAGRKPPPPRAPCTGDALLFWDMHCDGQTVDRKALHASCPTTKGIKWTATK
jgi:hypothetical protein